MSTDTVSVPPPAVRRIVTGHNSDGIAIVTSDETLPSAGSQAFAGIKVGAIWRTGPLPTNDNNDETDGATRTLEGSLGIVMESGTNVQFADFAPGAYVNMDILLGSEHSHGKIILIMEDGSETVVDKPGDVIVQRGTIHAWKNPGPEWTRVVTLILAAQPAVVNGAALPSTVVQ